LNAERRRAKQAALNDFYSMIFSIAARRGLSFFNFGYADPSQRDNCTEASEPYQLELYRQTALAVGADLFVGACVLEISSGLGGGLAYLDRSFKPRICIGLDHALPAVLSSRQRFGLITVQGEAEDLRLPNEAFDIVLNVEASHAYFGEAFLNEITRVLRPGGIAAISDARLLSPSDAEGWLKGSFARCGMQLRSFRDITQNVALACELDDPRREAFLLHVPRPLQSSVRAGLGGTTTTRYQQLRDKRLTYFIATAMK
jgi:SAM-dependent methyltransferase